MTDMGCNGVHLDRVRAASVDWVIAGGYVHEWTRAASCPVRFQHRTVVGGEVDGLVKVKVGPQETEYSRCGYFRLFARPRADPCAFVRPRK